MNTLKQVLTPVLIILLAAAIMIFGLILLDNTEWADSFRGGPPAQSVEGVIVSEESKVVGERYFSLRGCVPKSSPIYGYPGTLNSSASCELSTASQRTFWVIPHTGEV